MILQDLKIVETNIRIFGKNNFSMKNVFTLFIYIISSTTLLSQNIDFFDSNFKEALVNDAVVDIDNDDLGDVPADFNKDGEIQVSEAESIDGLFIIDKNISSLDGIENFSNLERLNCEFNFIQELDFSANLALREVRASFNELGTIKVSDNINLERLHVRSNELTEIDVSQNSNLTRLFCHNNLLTEIDVSNNTNLEFLYVYENLLSNIDVSSNPNLQHLFCNTNQIESLDLSQNPQLTRLLCFENDLTNLDLSGNINLEVLYAWENSLSILDLSQNANLLDIRCYQNDLTSLNLQNGNNTAFEEVRIYENPNLLCVQVDDIDYANSQDNWHKDEIASYSVDCGVLGEESVSLQEITLFPVPANDRIRLIDFNGEIKEYQILNLQGTVLIEGTKYEDEISIEGLSSGVYFIRILSEKNQKTIKFIKV